MEILALCLASWFCCGTPFAAPAQEDPRDKVFTKRFEQVEVRRALKWLFGKMEVSYLIAPDVQGTVSLEVKDCKPETLLRHIVVQVDGTYRMGGGIYPIVKRERVTPPLPPVKMSAFQPGAYSGAFQVRNRQRYVIRNRNVGAGYALLVSAASLANREVDSVCSYGEDGFAVAMKPESVSDKDGWIPRGAWTPAEADLPAGMLQRVEKQLDRGERCRFLVFLVSADPIVPGGLRSPERLVPAEEPDLPQEMKNDTWQTDPKLTVLLYEFLRDPATGAVCLRKPGEPGPSVETHVRAAGYWRGFPLR
jgi:hypothetical protein